MFKKVYLPLLCMAVFLSLLLTGCGCKHEWQAATCDAPKTCTKCNETEGEALTHSWVAADCETAKTCSLCKKTEGEALGHKWVDADCENPNTCSVCQKTAGAALGHKWVDADCANPKSCSVCQKTEGAALGHKWADADCENPKTCSVCQKAEGTALGHKWVDADCENPKTCSVCQKTDGYALGHELIPPTCETQGTCSVCEKILSEPTGHYWTPATIHAPKTCASCKLTEGTALPHDHEAAQKMYGVYYGQLRLTNEETGIEGFTGTLQLNITYVIRDHGGWGLNVQLGNKSQFLQDLENSYVAAFYAEFAQQGLNQAQADAAMTTTYGVDVRGYSKQLVNSVDWEEAYYVEEYGVFYINNGMIYTASDWGEEFESETISVSYGVLTLGSLAAAYPNLRMEIIGA